MNSIQSLTFDALTSFIAFADVLNFTRAAEGLHISQPALHVKVARLSELFGTPLYRRLGRRLELTETGRLVARFARDSVERATGFVDLVRTGTASQPVVLAAGEGAYLYLLGPVLRKYEQTSKVPLRLLTLDREATVEAVLVGKAHLGVAAMEENPEGLESVELCRVGQVLVVPAKHVLAKHKSIRLRDLDGARLVVPPAARPHRVLIGRALQSADVQWTVGVEANGWELILRFVELGMGLGIVNDFCRIPRGLVAIPIPDLPSIRYLVFHLPGLDAGPRARLRDALLEG